jgi:hypothetical protein
MALAVFCRAPRLAGQGAAAGAGWGARPACLLLGATGADGWGWAPGHLL